MFAPLRLCCASVLVLATEATGQRDLRFSHGYRHHSRDGVLFFMDRMQFGGRFAFGTVVDSGVILVDSIVRAPGDEDDDLLGKLFHVPPPAAPPASMNIDDVLGDIATGPAWATEVAMGDRLVVRYDVNSRGGAIVRSPWDVVRILGDEEHAVRLMLEQVIALGGRHRPDCGDEGVAMLLPAMWASETLRWYAMADWWLAGVSRVDDVLRLSLPRDEAPRPYMDCVAADLRSSGIEMLREADATWGASMLAAMLAESLTNTEQEGRPRDGQDELCRAIEQSAHCSIPW